MIKNLMILCLAGTLLPASLCASAGSDKAAGPTVIQKRCFCIQATPHSIAEYFLGKMETLPECADQTTEALGDFSLDKSGLLDCEVLQKCLTPSGTNQEKNEILTKKLSEAEANLAACCPKTEAGPVAPEDGQASPAPAKCEPKCSSDWEAIIRILKAEDDKVVLSFTKDTDACIAKAPVHGAKKNQAPGAGKKKKSAR